MTTMTDFLPWLIETMLATSVLLVIVMSIRTPVERLAGPQWAYLLWLIPGLRFVTAFIPDAVLSYLVVLDSSALFPALDLAARPVPQQYTPVVVVLVFVWVLGAAWNMANEILGHLRLRAQLIANSRPISIEPRRQVVQCAQAQQIHPAPETRISECQHGPALVGVFNPVLLLPGDFYQRYSVRQQKLMIQHELVHLSRRDLMWNILASGLRCLFWFNPLMRFCERRYRADQELACDHSVVAYEGRSERKLYGLALLIASQSRVSAGTASFLDDGLLVKRRLRYLPHHKRGLVSSTLGIAVLCVAGLWGSTVGVAPSPFDITSIIPALIAPEPVSAVMGCR
jgi:bla regulator protein BlaR1